jgi:hypothetical protein
MQRLDCSLGRCSCSRIEPAPLSLGWGEVQGRGVQLSGVRFTNINVPLAIIRIGVYILYVRSTYLGYVFVDHSNDQLVEHLDDRMVDYMDDHLMDLRSG